MLLESCWWEHLHCLMKLGNTWHVSQYWGALNITHGPTRDRILNHTQVTKAFLDGAEWKYATELKNEPMNICKAVTRFHQLFWTAPILWLGLCNPYLLGTFYGQAKSDYTGKDWKTPPLHCTKLRWQLMKFVHCSSINCRKILLAVKPGENCWRSRPQHLS